MAVVRDNAFCVRVWDWSETSQTVSLFAREHGLFRAVAKGSKRDQSAFSGGLELMTRGEALVSLKSSDSLSLLTAWDLQECFPQARTSLGVFRVGMLMLDVIPHALQPLDPHPQLFDALAQNLRSLTPSHLAPPLAAFLWAILSETGHRPELSRDVRSGVPLQRAETYTFAPRLGGLISPGSDPAGELTWKVRRETIDYLRDCQASPIPVSSAGRAARLLAAYFREVFHEEPKSLQPALDYLSRAGSPAAG